MLEAENANYWSFNLSADVFLSELEPSECHKWSDQSYDLQPDCLTGGHTQNHAPFHSHPPLGHTPHAAGREHGLQQHGGQHDDWVQLR